MLKAMHDDFDNLLLYLRGNDCDRGDEERGDREDDEMSVFTYDGDNGKDLFLKCAAGDLRLSADIDDVDRNAALTLLKKSLRILNDHWNDAEYAGMEPEQMPENEDDEAWERRYEAGQALLAEIREAAKSCS